MNPSLTKRMELILVTKKISVSLKRMNFAYVKSIITFKNLEIDFSFETFQQFLDEREPAIRQRSISSDVNRRSSTIGNGGQLSQFPPQVQQYIGTSEELPGTLQNILHYYILR